MTSRETTVIHTVKKSRPELRHHDSYRSSSASHEITSDYASQASSTTPKGYETPPSRISTPGPQGDAIITALSSVPAAAMPTRMTIRHVDVDNPIEVLPSTQMPAFSGETSPPSPGIDDTPYIRFAIEQLSFDEDLAGRGRYSTITTDVGVPQIVPADQLPIPQPPAPALASTPGNQRPKSFRFPSSITRPQARSQEVLLPLDPPDGPDHLKIGFIPVSLRLSMLTTLVFLCVMMVTGLIFSNVYALRHNGLYDYDGNTTARYFVFQYLPPLLGVVILLWLHFVQAAIYRTLPYIGMSTELPHDRVLQSFPILPANFVFPDLRFFRLKEPIVGIVLSIFWLMNFTIPLLSTLYQTQFYFTGLDRWRWTSVQGVGWTLVAVYVLLIGSLIYCIIRFRARHSALRSDPASLADIIMNFQRSNILHDFDQSEVCDDLTTAIPKRFLRLGYWTPSQTPETYFTVGQQNCPLNRISMQLEAKTQLGFDQSRTSDSFDMERHRYSQDSAFTRNIHSPFLRYRWCPWYLRDAMVLAWIIAAILLLIAFLVVSFVNRAVLDGFQPLLPSLTLSNGFSPSNFLYSFLPALLGQILFAFWQPIDMFYRSIQPYANLANPAGATAQQSLLQSYSANPPLWVTMSAIKNRDYKLAYITSVSIISAIIPVLGGAVFTAQRFGEEEVRMVASRPGYIALCVFLSIYALSYMVVWPSRKRYLPHAVDTIAGNLSFLYASQLLNDIHIRAASSKKDLSARLRGMVSSVSPQNSDLNEKSGLTGDDRRRPRLRDRHTGRGNKWVDRQLKYAFGIYIGRDGREHLGIDRLQRPGSGEMLVVTGMRRSLSRSFGSRSR